VHHYELYMLPQHVDARRHMSSALQIWRLSCVPANLPHGEL
jgi:hypothetical protein